MDMTSSQYVLDTSKEYAIYVCSNRAIPSVTDGLKDSQRKALWLLKNKNEKIKTVSLAGEMISSNIYLHGDSSAADAISKLAAPFINNVPFVDGIGAFGSRISPISGIGAPRYTYVKKSKAANDILFKDTNLIPLKENYDGSVMEPITFLPILPTVLFNGISGIAVGWSTDILPRKIDDLKTAVKAALDGKKIPDVNPHYSYLDVQVKKLEEENSWEFAGRVEQVDHCTLKITELPPGLDFEKFKDKLDKLEEEGKIANYEDNSTKNINITVKFKKGHFNKEPFSEEKYLDLLKLKSRSTERIVVLDWDGKKIKQYADAKELIKDFVDWRFTYYVKRYEVQNEERTFDLNFTLALIDCFDKGLPNDVLKLKTKADIQAKIAEYASTRNINDSQVDKIASLPIYRWTEEAYNKLIEEKAALEKELAYINDLLANPTKIKAIFKKEVDAI